jgi:hypothetical protein
VDLWVCGCGCGCVGVGVGVCGCVGVCVCECECVCVCVCVCENAILDVIVVFCFVCFGSILQIKTIFRKTLENYELFLSVRISQKQLYLYILHCLYDIVIVVVVFFIGKICTKINKFETICGKIYKI